MQPLSSLVAHKDVQRLHRRRACASVWVPFRLRGGCYRVVSYRLYASLELRYTYAERAGGGAVPGCPSSRQRLDCFCSPTHQARPLVGGLCGR